MGMADVSFDKLAAAQRESSLHAAIRGSDLRRLRVPSTLPICRPCFPAAQRGREGHEPTLWEERASIAICRGRPRLVRLDLRGQMLSPTDHTPLSRPASLLFPPSSPHQHPLTSPHSLRPPAAMAKYTQRAIGAPNTLDYRVYLGRNLSFSVLSHAPFGRTTEAWRLRFLLFAYRSCPC